LHPLLIKIKVLLKNCLHKGDHREKTLNKKSLEIFSKRFGSLKIVITFAAA
jgi:hypothetical protein